MLNSESLLLLLDVDILLLLAKSSFENGLAPKLSVTVVKARWPPLLITRNFYKANCFSGFLVSCYYFLSETSLRRLPAMFRLDAKKTSA